MNTNLPEDNGGRTAKIEIIGADGVAHELGSAEIKAVSVKPHADGGGINKFTMARDGFEISLVGTYRMDLGNWNDAIWGSGWSVHLQNVPPAFVGEWVEHKAGRRPEMISIGPNWKMSGRVEGDTQITPYEISEDDGAVMVELDEPGRTVTGRAVVIKRFLWFHGRWFCRKGMDEVLARPTVPDELKRELKWMEITTTERRME